MTAAYLDPRTRRDLPARHAALVRAGQAPLLLTPLPGIDAGRRSNRARAACGATARRCRSQVDEPITMGEGCTPLIRARCTARAALLKCEWMMPTGSFKDRGASVMLSLLRAQGVARGAGGQFRQRRRRDRGLCGGGRDARDDHGARLDQPGEDGADARAWRRRGADPGHAAGHRRRRGAARGELFYASHNWHPFFLQGTKTLAYELWEDLGFRAPDNVIIPCGAGSNVLGCEIGFSELLRAGEIERAAAAYSRPSRRIAAPIAAAFLAGSMAGRPSRSRPSPRARRSPQPIRLPEVLGALRESGGGAVMLTEAEIAGGDAGAGAHGIYVEPTAAQAAAAFGKLLDAGAIGPEQTTVLVLTGTGLKATPRIAEMLGVPQ